MSNQKQQTDGDGAKKYWSELEKKFPNINVYEQYKLAKAKYGRHPDGNYLSIWLQKANTEVIPEPPEDMLANVPDAPEQWKPPTKEDVLAYCESKKWMRAFGKHAWNTFIANEWKHFGHPIKSDEQWQAIMDTMEWDP